MSTDQSQQTVASTRKREKMKVLLVPFFVASHIGPFTDLAFRLTTAKPGTVEATIAVTPANASIVRSALARHGAAAYDTVKIVTYPFPAVNGLPPGVENLSTAAPADSWRIDAAAINEALMRPAQEALIRRLSPDVVVGDVHFFWNAGVAADLGVPFVIFSIIGTFSTLAMRHLDGINNETAEVVTVPGFPSPEIRIPRTELPELLRQRHDFSSYLEGLRSAQRSCFGLVMHTFFELEPEYCEMYVRNGFTRRTYFVGPLSLPSPPAGAGDSSCIKWLDSKPSRSVVYICFGSFAHISTAQLRELALGLEASGKPFLWALRTDKWTPPEGWEERVGDRSMLVRGWAPQPAILAHPAVGAFFTHCGSNSLLEAVVAGVPLLTWPMVFDQFIAERLVTEVLRIGARVWAGGRSTRYEEKEVVPAEAVAQAVARFLEPGGAGEAARGRAQELAGKANAAFAEGGSSYCDLHRLIDDLMEATGGGR